MYGLIGKSLSHSFSKRYFEEKYQFNSGASSDRYENFELSSIQELSTLLNSTPELEGFNVTIPYKTEIIPFMHELSEEAMQIGSANVVKISRFEGAGGYRLKGYNSDYWGFIESIKPHLNPSIHKALILGTGGSCNAVSYALEKSGISCLKVTRKEGTLGAVNYHDLNDSILSEHLLIVNTTPSGTWPEVENYPDIPFEYLTPSHLVFDLIYNPSETMFMKRAVERGAKVLNGYEMLCLQADRSLMIWKS
ncbi:MAG: shikimate dehydrogenase family protein [Bacteroidota bacterium]